MTSSSLKGHMRASRALKVDKFSPERHWENVHIISTQISLTKLVIHTVLMAMFSSLDSSIFVEDIYSHEEMATLASNTIAKW